MLPGACLAACEVPSCGISCGASGYRAILFLRVGEKTVDADWKRIGAKRYGMLHIYKGPQRVAAGAATREDEIVAMLERAR